MRGSFDVLQVRAEMSQLQDWSSWTHAGAGIFTMTLGELEDYPWNMGPHLPSAHLATRGLGA